MKLRRRGEELRQQFGNDFQVLYDTYRAEIQRVNDQMRSYRELPKYGMCVVKETQNGRSCPNSL